MLDKADLIGVKENGEQVVSIPIQSQKPSNSQVGNNEQQNISKSVTGTTKSNKPKPDASTKKTKKHKISTKRKK